MQYEIVNNGGAIKCLECGMTSHHPMDVKYRWCGKCNKCLDPAMVNEVAKIRNVLNIKKRCNSCNVIYDDVIYPMCPFCGLKAEGVKE